MGSNRRHRQRREARGPANRDPRRRLLVACEGQVTEPSYIEGFVRKTRNATVVVRILPEHGLDPRKLVEMAKSERDQARARARQQDDDFLAYDEVWCAFDRDQHERFEDACQMARDNQLELAVSNPCFELWLLLHFRESPGAQHRRHLQKKLEQFLPGYDKHFDFDLVADRVDQAVRRARRLHKEATRLGEPFLNPTTGVYRLIESIARVERPATGSDSAPPPPEKRPARAGSRRPRVTG
jgi:hypothetical protein